MFPKQGSDGIAAARDGRAMLIIKFPVGLMAEHTLFLMLREVEYVHCAAWLEIIYAGQQDPSVKQLEIQFITEIIHDGQQDPSVKQLES